MLFTQSELEQLHNEAWEESPTQGYESFQYDSAVAKGEVRKLWADGESSGVFKNNHGCWDIFPTVN